jgi:hypothetical protein
MMVPIFSHLRTGGRAVDVRSDSRASRRPRLYFARVPEDKTIKNRVHLDVMPADRTQDEEIARLTRLGPTVVSDRRPEFGWVLLADPEGNEFCVEISVGGLESAEAAAAVT